MITYEEFLSIINDDLRVGTNFDPTQSYRRRDNKDDEKPRAAIGETWTTGGEQGGSCWDTGDDDPHYPVEAEPEPKLEDLTKVLEHICPSMSFLCFKRMSDKLIREADGFGSSEYYGNYTTASAKYIYMDELYEFLKAEDILPETRPPKPEDKDDE
jgi:hypothetical protein